VNYLKYHKHIVCTQCIDLLQLQR